MAQRTSLVFGTRNVTNWTPPPANSFVSNGTRAKKHTSVVVVDKYARVAKSFKVASRARIENRGGAMFVDSRVIVARAKKGGSKNALNIMT